MFVICSPPSFKTATQLSRTQLKLQLMREQLQEQERREAAAHARRPPPAPALRVPVQIQSIGIDVPPQVLKVNLLSNDKVYRIQNVILA